jgi:YesN/AraC family two-component response regulator
MKLFIKNTVNLGKLAFVRDELERIGLHAVSVEIDEITMDQKFTISQFDRLCQILQQAGIELFQNKKEILVQKIKNVILDVVLHHDDPLVHNLSTYLAEKLQHDYTYMSNLFSQKQHITIEKFYICQKIERVKEMLVYEKLSLTDIAHKMHYSSVAHLSSQFKKVTGLTPSQFKQRHTGNDLPPEMAAKQGL